MKIFGDTSEYYAYATRIIFIGNHTNSTSEFVNNIFSYLDTPQEFYGKACYPIYFGKFAFDDQWIDNFDFDCDGTCRFFTLYDKPIWLDVNIIGKFHVNFSLFDFHNFFLHIHNSSNNDDLFYEIGQDLHDSLLFYGKFVSIARRKVN